MTAVRVNLKAVTDAGVAAKQRSVLATLPMSLVEGAGGSPLVLVDARFPEWPEVAAEQVDLGASGLFIDRPTVRTSPRAVCALAGAADQAGVKVALNEMWCSVQAVHDLAGAVAASGGAALIDSLIEIPPDVNDSYRGVLFEHVRVVQAIAGKIDAVQLSSLTPHGYTVVARQGGASTMLCSVRTASVLTLRISVHSPEQTAQLKVVSDGTASPAECRIVDGSGNRTEPTHYESGDRNCWKRLLAKVTDGTPSEDLRDLAESIQVTLGLTATTRWGR
jgi:hypothetical protein